MSGMDRLTDEAKERAAFEAWWPTEWPNRGSIPDIVWQGWLGRASQAAPAHEDQFVTKLPQEAFDAFDKACEDAPAPSDGLRERAEAAEAERDDSRAAYLAHKLLRIDAEQQARAARRAEAAAWNDAIEAAALMADGIYKEAAEYRLHLMAVGASKCRDDIRALRRAAPTEGEA